MMLASGSGGAAVLLVLWFLVIAVSMALYFIPTIIAAVRHHPQTVAIGALNLLLGWTFLGWLAALVWSLTNSARPAMVVNQWTPSPYAVRPPSGPPPGWYPDSSGRTRYWSGTAWTEHYQ